MLATGLFSSVDVFDTTSSTPTLSAISGYGFVLAWTDSIPSSGAAVGNLLASYYALGGRHLTVATYGFSNPWEISGTIMTGGYVALTNVGANGDVSGNVVASVPSDPIFSGITLSTVTFSHNGNYSHPGLASGATLLATDGAGINMIARSSLGVVNVNMWPGGGGSASFFKLLGQTLTNGSTLPPTPAPPTWILLATGLAGLALYQMKDRWLQRVRSI
ncbi:MAG TPA: hypothetical protein VMT15_04485 [Bryobacteraceae bacterium]|nr:hypothetical protein [Bryobacteraceae bacterium]